MLTCGGFENNQEMIRNYLPGVPYCYTSGSPYNEGDGIAMAMSVRCTELLKEADQVEQRSAGAVN